jgi:DNA primase
MQFTLEDHHFLRSLILKNADAVDIYQRIEGAAPGPLGVLMARPHVQIAPPVRNKLDSELATLCLAEELAKLDAHRGARREIAEAVEDFEGLVDEGLTWRLSQSAAARHRADSPNRESAADLGEDRASLSNHLQNLIDNRAWEKKSR